MRDLNHEFDRLNEAQRQGGRNDEQRCRFGRAGVAARLQRWQLSSSTCQVEIVSRASRYRMPHI